MRGTRPATFVIRHSCFVINRCRSAHLIARRRRFVANASRQYESECQRNQTEPPGRRFGNCGTGSQATSISTPAAAEMGAPLLVLGRTDRAADGVVLKRSICARELAPEHIVGRVDLAVAVVVADEARACRVERRKGKT